MQHYTICRLLWNIPDNCIFIYNPHNSFSVGGIYTVIRSKAYVSTEEMGDQYCLIGPYKEQSARTEVEEADFPPHNPLHQAVQVLRDQGYKVNLF